MPRCCYLATGARRPSYTTNMKTLSNTGCNICNILAVTTLKASNLNSTVWERIFIFCGKNRPPLDKTRDHIALLFHWNWMKITRHYYINELHFIFSCRWALFAHFLGSKMSDSWSKLAEPPTFFDKCWRGEDHAIFENATVPGLTPRCCFNEITRARNHTALIFQSLSAYWNSTMFHFKNEFFFQHFSKWGHLLRSISWYSWYLRPIHNYLQVCYTYQTPPPANCLTSVIWQAKAVALSSPLFTVN